MSDNKIQRMSLEDIETRAVMLMKQERTDEANNLLAYAELRRMLVCNAERDLLLAQAELRLERLENICFDLHADRTEVRKAFNELRHEHQLLKRQQDDLRNRQDIIAAVIDTGIDRISEITDKIKALTENVRETSEP